MADRHLTFSEEEMLVPLVDTRNRKRTIPSEATRALQLGSLCFREESGALAISNDSSIAKAFQANKMSRVTSFPSLVQFGAPQMESKSPNETAPPKGIKRRRTRLSNIPNSVSAPSLQDLEIQPVDGENENKSIYTGINPLDYLKHIFVEHHGREFKTFSSLEAKGFFLDMKDAHVQAYTSDVIEAVRKEQVGDLRRLEEAGKSLQACNKFGESILHMACRRGATRVVHYLVKEAGVSVKVHDDYGRNPLHDACWTREPELELVALLVATCPDLLLLKDKRGFTPLEYVRRHDWKIWCQFLDEHRGLLLPQKFL